MPPDSINPSIKNPDQLLEKVLLETIKEQRRKRRWGIFFKLVYLSLFIFIIWGLCSPNSIGEKITSSKKQIAQINLRGEISPHGDVTAEDTIEALDHAANDKNTQAILLVINSPGGTPVQASYIYNEIRRLKLLHQGLAIDAVCEDLCASAAYYIASATDQIYANPASLVGSVGVLMDGFGFVDTLKKVGATRRLYTAGQYKGFLDPFSPEKPEEIAFLKKMLDSDHQIFIHDVKMGRGSRLKEDPNLFSGLVWNGVQAKALGLIDGFGSVNDVAMTLFHNENITDYTVKHGYLDQISSRFGARFWHEFKTQFFSTTMA